MPEPEVCEKSAMVYGEASRPHPLPFPKPFSMPLYPGPLPLNPAIFQESCGVRILTGTVVGAGLGVVLGVFLGAMGDNSPIQIMHGREVPQAPLAEQLRQAYKQTAARSISFGKNFAHLSALFAGTECVIEKYRGKHDVWNAVLSGCAAGAALSASQGPQAACASCVGFAAFSAIIDSVMGPH